MGTAVGIAIVLLLLLAVPAFCIVAFIRYARTKKQGWLVAGIVTAVLSLIPLGLFVAGLGLGFYQGFKRQTQYTQGTTALPTDRRVRSPDGALQLRVAGHWRTLTNLNERAVLQLGSPAREEYLIVLTDAKSDYSGSLADYATLTSQSIRDRLGDGRATKMQKIALQGREAYQCELIGTIGALKVDYLFTAMEGKDGYYQLLAWTLPSKKQAAFQTFHDVLQTCEWR